jgi:hypothetical protein
MARASREHILGEIRRLADANRGVAPSRRAFEAASGIGAREWTGHYWARWSDAVREAGYEPQAFQGRTHEDEALIRLLADVTRDLGRFPTTPDLRIWRREHEGMVPNDKVFSAHLGTKAEQMEKVRQFARAHADYADVAAICEASTIRRPRPITTAVPTVVTGVVYLIRMGEFHKIGKSNDPGRRLYELGLRLPERHDVVHVIETDDPSGIEAYWHRRFASQRANGEWFRLAPGDVAAFRRRRYM